MTDLKPYSQYRFFRIQLYILMGSLSILAGARISRLVHGWLPGTAALVIALFGAGACFGMCLILLGWLGRKEEINDINSAALFVSVCAVYGLTLMVPSMYKSILWLLMAIMVFFWNRTQLCVYTSGQVVNASGILGWIFAFLILIGSECAANALDSQVLWGPAWSTFYELAYRIFAFTGLGLFFSVSLNALFSLLLSSDFRSGTSKEGNLRTERKECILFLSCILILWLPYYIAFYPGILEKDSISEISQQLGLEVLSDHHPIMHQMIIRMCIQLGQRLGSLQIGVGIYSALQMIILAAVFALCICRLKRYGARHEILVAVFLFYAVFTVNAFFSVTMWKDVLFGAASLLLIMLMNELVAGQIKPGWKSYFIILPVVWFFSTLRNNGYYGLLIGMFLMIVMNKSIRKFLLILMLSIILLVSAFHYALFDVVGVTKTRTAMMLSVPLQQVARVVKFGNPDLDDENFSVMREVFPDLEELKEDYLPLMSDPVVHPNVFESEVFDENPARYMKAWLNIGLQHPRIYVEAFLLQCYGYWYPDVDNLLVYPKLRENEIGLEANTAFSALRDNLLEMHEEFSRLQPVSALYSLGLQVWLLAISSAVLILKDEKARCGPVMILFGLWLTILDGPLYGEYRYLYGLVVCVPFYTALAVTLPNRNGQNGKERNGNCSEKETITSGGEKVDTV